MMPTISTHVLDTSIGRPAHGVAVRLEVQHEAAWTQVAGSVTDVDGRVRDLGSHPSGTYRLRFEVAPYFTVRGVAAFFAYVEVAFIVGDAAHYHVPLLISPFGYSTYRGS